MCAITNDGASCSAGARYLSEPLRQLWHVARACSNAPSAEGVAPEISHERKSNRRLPSSISFFLCRVSGCHQSWLDLLSGHGIHGKGLRNDLAVAYDKCIGAHRDFSTCAPGDIGYVSVDSEA